MYLFAYLEFVGMSQTDFAKELGISQGSIGNYIAGTRTPSLEIARKIEKKTKGKVTIDELLEYAKKKRNHHGSTTDSTSMDV